MSLSERPHTVIVEIPDRVPVPEGFSGMVSSSGQVTLLGQITPKSMAYAAQRYGVELARPHKLMANIEDSIWLMNGARVRWMLTNHPERTFYIVTPVRYHAQGDECDHVSVMMEEEV